MEKTHELIQDGNKLKFIYLRMPNTLKENVIGFTEKLPKEFNMHRYIDHEMQFEKTFIAPLRTITDIIGWKIERVNTLESLFA